MQEWSLTRPANSCFICKAPFQQDDVFYSGIVEINSLFERREYCLPCWQANSSILFSFWQRRFTAFKKPAIEDVNQVIEFFKKICQLQDPAYDRIKFLSALILLRKKRLKIISTPREGDKNYIILEKNWDAEMIKIIDPGIKEEELEAARKQMEELFDLEAGSQDFLAKLTGT